MLAQRCMGWHDLSGKIPVHRSEKRWRRQTNKMFEGDLWMAQRLRNGVFFLQGHDGESPSW